MEILSSINHTGNNISKQKQSSPREAKNQFAIKKYVKEYKMTEKYSNFS